VKKPYNLLILAVSQFQLEFNPLSNYFSVFKWVQHNLHLD